MKSDSLNRASSLTMKTDQDDQIAPLPVAFIEDGAKPADPKTKSFKLDINKYIYKYELKVSKFLGRRPPALVDAQSRFNERAYAELLEDCNAKVNRKRKDEDIKTIVTLFANDGRELKTVEDIQEFLAGREDGNK